MEHLPFGVALLYKLGAALAYNLYHDFTDRPICISGLTGFGCTSATELFPGNRIQDACDTALYDEQLVVRYEHRIRVRWIQL